MNSLLGRCILGLLKSMILMAGPLFLCAGTFRYWQGWVFLAVFELAVTPITMYLLKSDPALLERRLKAGSGAEKEVSQKIIQAFTALIFVGFFVVSGFDHRFGWSHLSLFGVIAGDVLVVLGLWMVFLVFRENGFTSATVEIQQGQSVISSGPYALVRHPMYSGALVMMLGIPLALGSWRAVWFFLPMFILLIVRLIHEERFLVLKLPGYAQYREQTRYRLVPLIF